MLPHTAQATGSHEDFAGSRAGGPLVPRMQAVQKIGCPTRGGRRSTRHPEAGGLGTSPRSRPCEAVVAGCGDTSANVACCGELVGPELRRTGEL